MAFGMFCAIPLPFHIWDEDLTAVMVASFPLIGLFIGAIWWVCALLFSAIGFPAMITAAILSLIPFFIAGFIHLDGFMDTSDAHLSRRDLPDRLRILKDPQVGAFAVIMVIVLLLLQFAAMYTISDNGRFFALLITISVISRSCSALSIFVLRHMPESNYAALLSKNVGKSNKIFIAIIGITAVFLSVIYAGVLGLIVAFAVILGYACAMRVVYKSFSGISGDLLGYSMVISELCGLIALSLMGGIL